VSLLNLHSTVKKFSKVENRVLPKIFEDLNLQEKMKEFDEEVDETKVDLVNLRFQENVLGNFVADAIRHCQITDVEEKIPIHFSIINSVN
jgi:hypothetical protein